MIYFTSDLHLCHANAIKHCDRPFENVEEMNEALIANINSVVGVHDELYILGDFSFKGSKEDVACLRRQINCWHIHLINGNHDKHFENDNIFSSVQDYKELKTPYGKLILFHYPIYSWNGALHGFAHLHGHIHSRGEYNENNLKSKYTDRFPDAHPNDPDMPLRIYDVGVDANNFKPISLEEIASLLKLEKIGA